MIFLDNGKTMVVTISNYEYVLFFNQMSDGSKDYVYDTKLSVSYTNPHGLRYVNDKYFYVTSLTTNRIYTYYRMPNSTSWTEELFLDANSIVSSSSGNHLIIDECDRYWFSLGSNGIRLFDNQGSLLSNITSIVLSSFDILITDNYVVYLSDDQSNQIVRIDLNIQC